MKLEVHTLRFGSTSWLAECAPTLKTWCERHDHNLVVWDDPAAWENYPTPKFIETDALRGFLKGTATHFAWVDADVLVHPEAPAMPGFTGIAMATDDPHAEHQEHWEEWCHEQFGKRPSGFRYSNAGVYFIDRAAAEKLVKVMTPPFIESFQEQHQFNWWVSLAHESGVPFTRLPSEWNRYGRDLEPSWFFHVWGEHKEADLEVLRKTRMATLKPSDLIHNVRPVEWPSADKVVVQEFIQDAGLGNQLFEWAAGYGIAKKLGLPFRWIWRPSRKREFGLTHFGIGENPHVEYPMLMARVGQGHRKFVDLALKRIEDSKERFCGISCPFQSEECFIDVADDIRAIYKLEPFPLEIPAGTTPVGVQVRRGDYVGHPKLNVVTPDYFRNAMAWIRERVSNPHFFIVSDDPAWCQRQFGRQTGVTVMPPQQPVDGLRTLASCEAHIISNSTFGWWGAWLGEKGPVVVPEIWHHKPGSYGDWNPVPSRWHRVSIHPPGSVAPITLPAVLAPVASDGLRAIVYPWHADQEKWHELRYSLRSIEKHFADKTCPIYIMGTRRPGWLVEHPRVKYLGAWSYQDALVRGLKLADTVMWMNDDIVLLKDVTWADVEVPRYVRAVDPAAAVAAPEQPNPWRESCRKVLAQLVAEGTTDLKLFSTHTPYVYGRDKAEAVLRRFGAWEKFPMELAYFHQHGDGATEIGGDRVHDLPLDGATYLNHTDHTLKDAMKDELRRRFPNFAPWELKLAFNG